MNDSAASELRSSTLALLARLDRGEIVEITVGGKDMSVHRPVGKGPRFMGRETFIRGVFAHPADAGLRDGLLELGLGGTTDDPRSA